MGSPAYMSPEQIRHSKHVDVRTDIWAFGVCLYQMLTGTLPFDAPSIGEIAAKILNDSPRPPQEACASVSLDVSKKVLRCLEKDPARRYASLAELATDLEPHASPQDVGVAERLRRIALWTGPTETFSAETEPKTLPFQAHTLPLAQASRVPLSGRPLEASSNVRQPPAATSAGVPSGIAWPRALALILVGLVAGGGGAVVLMTAKAKQEPAPAATQGPARDEPSEAPSAPTLTTSAPTAEPNAAAPATDSSRSVASSSPRRATSPRPVAQSSVTPALSARARAPAVATPGVRPPEATY
jgi:serine/threonine-protein kinase